MFLLSIALAAPAFDAEPEAAPSGVYTAEFVPDSPNMAAAGMVWWKDYSYSRSY